MAVLVLLYPKLIGGYLWVMSLKEVKLILLPFSLLQPHALVLPVTSEGQSGNSVHNLVSIGEPFRGNLNQHPDLP